MMDGVTILNTWTEVHVTNWIGGLITVIFMSITVAFLLFLIVSVINGIIEHYWRGVAIGICCCVTSAALTLFSFQVIGQPKCVTIYEVTMSDDVSFNEFMERYTIISQRGNIYKVEDKNNA